MNHLMKIIKKQHNIDRYFLYIFYNYKIYFNCSRYYLPQVEFQFDDLTNY